MKTRSPFKNKKGSELINNTIVDIILISFILITILGGILKISDSSVHIERSKVRDIAFLYDSLNIKQQNFNIIYNMPTKDTTFTLTPKAKQFNFEISISPSCKVQIKELTKQIPSTYFCSSFNEKIQLTKDTNNNQILKSQSEQEQT